MHGNLNIEIWTIYIWQWSNYRNLGTLASYFSKAWHCKSWKTCKCYCFSDDSKKNIIMFWKLILTYTKVLIKYVEVKKKQRGDLVLVSMEKVFLKYYKKCIQIWALFLWTDLLWYLIFILHFLKFNHCFRMDGDFVYILGNVKWIFDQDVHLIMKIKFLFNTKNSIWLETTFYDYIFDQRL